MPQKNASANLLRLGGRPQFAETPSTLAPIKAATLEAQVGYFETTPALTQTSLNKSPAPDAQVGQQLTKTISPDLGLALRPRPAEFGSKTLDPIEAATFNTPFENREIDNKNFEITPAPPPKINPPTSLDKSPAPKAQYDNQVIMSEIFKSPEFIYAVVATMVENIAHNDPNKFQNKQALKILEELSKESTNQDPFQDILKLAEFAKDRKTLDRNYSLAADSIRLIAGAIVLSSSIYESSKKVDDSEVGIAHEISSTAQALSAGTQIIASLKTSYEGYQASIVGHFAEELSDAFESVANKLASKLGESKQDCSDPNHEHAKTGQQEG
jgi:hypothetical protein